MNEREIFIVQFIDKLSFDPYKNCLHMTIIPPCIIDLDEINFKSLAKYEFMSTQVDLHADTFEWFGYKKKVPVVTYKTGSFIFEVRNYLAKQLNIRIDNSTFNPHIALKPGLTMPPNKFRLGELSLLDRKTKEVIYEVYI